MKAEIANGWLWQAATANSKITIKAIRFNAESIVCVGGCLDSGEEKVARIENKRHSGSIVMIVVLGLLAFYFYKLIIVDRMGFCYRRLWFVSSEEMILNTIGGLMKAQRIKPDDRNPTPQAYLANHPNCCSVDWGGESVFGRGLIYFGSATVSVIYEMGNEDKVRHGATENTHFEYIADKTACGETIGRTGMTTKAPEAQK